MNVEHAFHVDIFDNPETATQCRVREGYGYCQIPRNRHPDQSAPRPAERPRQDDAGATTTREDAYRATPTANGDADEPRGGIGPDSRRASSLDDATTHEEAV